MRLVQRRGARPAYPDTQFNVGSDKEWSLIPAQTPALGEWNDNFTDIFDWMFSKSKGGEPEVASAKFGTPALGTDDALWNNTITLDVNKSSAPDQEVGPKATGKAKVLWDEDFLYVRVDVTDEQVSLGQSGAGSEHMNDSIEVYLGRGSRGANQWRLGANGNFAGGQNATGRDGKVTLTDTGYIAELKIPRKTVEFTNGAPITFEVYINNSTAAGGDRYEVVSAMGAPDTAYNSDAAYRDSLLLWGGPEQPRPIVTATAGTNGTVAPSGQIRVAVGGSQTFTFTPVSGYVVDTVTVDGTAVTVTDNSYTLENVQAEGHALHVTFKPASDAKVVDFIVYNDNFATGEFTTAVIIDLGEGNETASTALNKDLFTVTARDTMLNGDLAFAGTRTVKRVYANNEPRPLGYLGVKENSPDYAEGLAKGRYIVVELEFWTQGGGNGTLQGSNSTLQNYNIVANGDIAIDGKAAITKAAFAQTDVVNEIIDQFVEGPQIDAGAMEYGLYIHKDENGDPVEKLPLYIYTHGSTRGGTQEGDTFAPIRSTNGAIALMKKMEENPEKYASHIIARRAFTNNSHASATVLKAYIDDLVEQGLVDPDRVYASGFSMGASATNSLLTSYPNLLAAAAPMSWSPINANQAKTVKDVAYWTFANTTDSVAWGVASGTQTFINNAMQTTMTQARATIIDRNEIFVWPYDQWTKEEAPINGTNWLSAGHEMEASVLYSHIAAYPDTQSNIGSDKEWSLIPAQSPVLGEWDDDYEDVFDWMFAQSKGNPEVASAKFGTPALGTNDALWNDTVELSVGKSSAPDQTVGPKATGKARVLWDEDFLYVRVDVTDEQVSLGQAGAGSEHMNDSIEVYLGSGRSGNNQWRLGANGNFAGGQNAAGRQGSVELTDTGYIAELKIPRRTVEFTNGAPITFEVYINNSTAAGGDRYEVVSAMGAPDTAYSSSTNFENSLMLWGGPEQSRPIVTATAGANGTISPSGLIRVAEGGNQTFTFAPVGGYVVDAVTVDGAAVTVTDNSYTLENVQADGHTIHVTFKPASDAKVIDFIVYNDNFATGEFTTAVIIDLGAGNEISSSALNKDLFTVSARDTMLNGDLAFVGTRTVTRVYANDEPRPLGYMGSKVKSPGYQDGLAKGRYIVVELEFWTLGGGNGTLQGSDSTLQNYNIVANGDIALDGKAAITKAAFAQTDVVNEIIDQFEVGPTPEGVTSMEYGRYIHKDENGEPAKGLPLYIYSHGSTRGGTQPNDTFAPIRSANGAIALMRKIEENPGKYASHIYALRATNNRHASAATVKAHIDDLVAKGLVDPDRIYISGFSMGGGNTNTLLNTYPDLFAAAAPISSGPINATQAANVNNVSYWVFANTTDSPANSTRNFINGAMQTMTNARATLIDRNEVFVWPYDQWTKEEAPINGTTWITSGHEMEASVLYSHIDSYPGTLSNVGSDKEWSLIPAQSPALGEWDSDYEDYFDWMFAQKRVAPSYISITPEHSVLYAGSKATLTLIAEPSDMSLGGITWSTSDTESKIIDFAPAGNKLSAVVTGKASGSVTITAEGGGYKATATIEVLAAPIDNTNKGNYKVDILTDKETINKAKIDGVLIPINITSKDAGSVSTEAENSSQIIHAVDVIDKSGNVDARFTATPVSDRYVMVSAKIDTKNSTYKNMGLRVTFVGEDAATIDTATTLQLKVSETYPKITLKAGALNLYYPGKTATVTGTSADGSAVTIEKVEYGKNASNYVSIGEDYAITPVKKGSAKLSVTVKLDGYVRPYKVTKSNPNGNVAALTAKVVDAAPKFTVALKGKIDIINPDSAVTATVKLSGLSTSIASVALTDVTDGAFEAVGLNGDTFAIKTAAGKLPVPGAKYSFGVQLTMSDGEVVSLAKPISIKPTQSKAKAWQSTKSATLYKVATTQGEEVQFDLTTPAGVKLSNAQINAASVKKNDYFKLERNGEGSWVLKFKDGFDPSAQKLKSSYTVKVELWADGAYDGLDDNGRPVPLGITNAKGKFTAKSKATIVSIKVNVK